MKTLAERPTSEKAKCLCGRSWPSHRVIVCPGSIACGGVVAHDCAIPGCMEPEFGVHGEQCPGYLIACPR